MNLVPVGELKPLAFFKFHDDTETICKKLADEGKTVWYAWYSPGGLMCQTASSQCLTVPMPSDCDSFDWQPPREPTALELAKALLINITGEGAILSRPWFRAELAGIIAEMEREAEK